MTESLESLKENLINTIHARHPVVGIVTEDEIEVLSLLKEDLADSIGVDLIFFYDHAKGLEVIAKGTSSYLEDIKEEAESLDKDITYVLEFVEEKSKEFPSILLIKSADKILIGANNSSEQIASLRYLKNIVNDIKSGQSLLTIILLMESLQTFPLIDKDIIVYELSFPNRKEIREMIDEFLEEHELFIDNQLKNEFVSAFQGLTRTEIDNLLYMMLLKDNTLNESDIDFIFNYKKQVVSKKGILEFIDLKKLPENVGGLKNLKNWLNRKKEIFDNLDEAIKSGVPIPKGVLLFGMPGCGKSMTAKYSAKLLKLPLLRLDMGKIMGPYLGQSEENMRKAILLAENISPSILWIDEIEKALSGVKGSQGNDTLVRIFGTLLTWMQEKDKPVFVIATANDISILPPEFLRKGRFDEIFFVDFPKKEEMKEILKIHLKRAKQDLSKINLDEVVNNLEFGYSGADIEAIVNETVERVFVERKEKINTDDLIQTIKQGSIIPTKELLKDSIEELRKKIEKIKARNAN